MKTKNIPYNEAKQLLLQGEYMKLPEWEGYWKFDDKENQVFAHLKDGGIAPAQAKYTFNENWEIATAENCPMLKKELLAKQVILNGKIISVKPVILRKRNDLSILFMSGTKVVDINFSGLESLIGLEEAKRMLDEYMGERIKREFPEEVAGKINKFFESFEEVCESIVKDVKEDLNK